MVCIFAMVLHDLAFHGFLHCYGRFDDTMTIGWVGYVKVRLKFHHIVLHGASSW
jgi:hypothetical protein